MPSPDYDLFIIGGGINGLGIARDASGQNLKVGLCEKNDLASGTSSASSKLVHGGLRYLEQYEFKLVRESLQERDKLIKIAPHLVTPLRFILPHTKNQRPFWLIKLGLMLYDTIGGKSRYLPKSKNENLKATNFSSYLQAKFTKGFSYSDCWVDDARLCIFNAMDARKKGADIFNYTELIQATRKNDYWELTLKNNIDNSIKKVKSKILINAAGPWAFKVFRDLIEKSNIPSKLKYIQGSHFIVPKLYEGEHAYILQTHDNRIIFVIPYRQEFSLIGTTDTNITEAGIEEPKLIDQEKAYLLEIINQHFKKQTKPTDIIWDYSGVRPLYNDGEDNPSKITRDYVLDLQYENTTTPLLNIYGGKLTTYRHLSEKVLLKLAPYLKDKVKKWTHLEPLPGGNFDAAQRHEQLKKYCNLFSNLSNNYIEALFDRHGTNIDLFIHKNMTEKDLGYHYGETLYKVEVDYLLENEFVYNADDILWRRTKAGIYTKNAQVEKLKNDIAEYFNLSKKQLKSSA